MTDQQKAKSMLPNMPNEVFDTWLRPIIKDHSWPYSNTLSSHPSDQWRRYFAFYTLNDISNCLWDKLVLTFDPFVLDSLSNDTIEILIQDHVYGHETNVRNVRDSKKRFFGFVEYIKRTRSMPAPVIGINTPSGLRILDGNHRLSALTYLGLRGCIHCDTWVGHPPISY